MSSKSIKSSKKVVKPKAIKTEAKPSSKSIKSSKKVAKPKAIKTEAKPSVEPSAAEVKSKVETMANFMAVTQLINR